MRTCICLPESDRKGEISIKTRKHIEPIRKAVTAKSHTPQYKMHKYFARRPCNVFQNLIEHYTKKGDVILDCFCGGGVTVFEAAALERKVIGVDVNPLAAFITRMQMFHGDIEELQRLYDGFIAEMKTKLEKWYQVDFPDDSGISEWFEWVYAVTCPQCGGNILLTAENKIRSGLFRCANSGCPHHQDGVKRIACTPAGSLLLRICYRSDQTGKSVVRIVSREEADKMIPHQDYEAVLSALPHRPNFTIPLDWDRQQEDKLKERGVLEYRQLFTDRNYTANCCIFHEILQRKNVLPADLYEMLYFLFSSSLRYTNNMTRVTDHWENGKPTAMDRHAYWLPNQYVETNVLHILEKRAAAILNGVRYSKTALPKNCREAKTYQELLEYSNGYCVWNRSAARLPLPDRSVDVIITDPPYGSNVQYAELSSVWNVWYAHFQGLKHYIFKEEEAVVNRKTKIPNAKTEFDYEELLYQVYRECGRVIKPGGYLVFTFNNKNIRVWIAMMRAVARAGFYLPENGVIFQDFIQSYKNTAHLQYAGNIHGDFIYSFVRGENPASPLLQDTDVQEIIKTSIEDALDTLYRKRKGYTTTQLYQQIFSRLANVLMTYISVHLDDSRQMGQIARYSDATIDSILKRRLVYRNEKWYCKNRKNEINREPAS